MFNEDVQKFYQSMYSRCTKSQWQKFIKALKSSASVEDKYELIDITQFESIVNVVLGLKISQKQKELINNTSGRMLHGVTFINIGLIYQ